MTVHIRQALKTISDCRSLWWGLYAVKLALALVMTLPVLLLIQADLDYSTFSKPLLHDWSLDVIGELILTNPHLISTSMAILAFFAIVVFLIKQFLNGGIFGALWHRDGLHIETFFSRCGKEFGSHIKISLGMLPIYIGLLIIGALAAFLVGFVARKAFPTIGFSIAVLRMAALILVMSLGVVFSDLVRLNRAAHPGENLSKAFSRSQKFAARHVAQTVGLFLAFFVPFVIFWLLIEGMALAVTGSLGNMIGVIIEFVLFQVCSFARVGQSLSVTAALASSLQVQTGSEATSTTQEVSIDGATLLP